MIGWPGSCGISVGQGFSLSWLHNGVVAEEVVVEEVVVPVPLLVPRHW